MSHSQECSQPQIDQRGWGTHIWYIVTVPCEGYTHDQTIADWCQEQFGYVHPGAIRSLVSQSFWFANAQDAHEFWLAWS